MKKFFCIFITLLSVSCGEEIDKLKEREKGRNEFQEELRRSSEQTRSELEKRMAFDLTSKEESCNAAEEIRKEMDLFGLIIISCEHDLAKNTLTIAMNRDGHDHVAEFDLSGQNLDQNLNLLDEKGKAYYERFQKFINSMNYKIESSIKFPVGK